MSGKITDINGPSGEACRLCRFWEPFAESRKASDKGNRNTDIVGECHRFPPTPFIADGKKEILSTTTFASRWCGEFVRFEDDTEAA